MKHNNIWDTIPVDIKARLSSSIGAAAEQAQPGPVHIFFRADDVGVPGKQFGYLKEIFSKHQVPLCLAVVPAWLTAPRWEHLQKPGRHTPELWCWHQHGWRHMNHEKAGRKQEFGPSRQRTAVFKDLVKGRRRLEEMMGNKFYPVFTPPWNRCGLDTLEHLRANGYNAVSRRTGAQPATRDGLPDLFVNVDLHTRKEADPKEGWNSLLAELQHSISTGYCGIMIHHQRMNTAAFEFLDFLLSRLVECKNVSLVDFRDLIGTVK